MDDPGYAQAEDPNEPRRALAAIVGRTDLTVADFTGIWAALPQNRAAMLRLALIALAVPGFAVVHASLNARAEGDAFSMPSYVLLSMVVVAGALGFGLWRGRTRWAENAMVDLRGAAGVEFRFDEQGFSSKAPGREFTLAWGTLVRCLETPNAFAIYSTPVLVTIIPKRAFAASDLPKLRALLLARVPNRPLRGMQPRFGRMILLWAVLVVAFLAIWLFLSPK